MRQVLQITKPINMMYTFQHQIGKSLMNKLKTGQVKDIRNVEYESSIEKDGAEWSTQFDANNYYTPNEEDNHKLGKL